jgi:putative DNA primase/helicase
MIISKKKSEANGQAVFSQLNEFLSPFFADQNEPVHLRLFKAKGDPDSQRNRPRVIKTSRHELFTNKKQQSELQHLNQTLGIYFVVNAGGNTDKSITRYNSFFAESDNISIADQHALLDAASLQASIRIETAKSVHAYWLIDGKCAESDWREIQARMIAYFKSDRTIKNPSRVMRLPLFNHVSLNGDSSYHYKRVEIKMFAPDRRYTVRAMLDAFPRSENLPLESNNEKKKHCERGISWETWDALWAEWGRRLRQDDSARKNSAGNWDCRGICHNGEGNTGLVYFPDTNRGHCNAGCDESTVLCTFGLPEKPSRIKTLTTEHPASYDPLESLRTLTKDSKPSEIESALRHFAARLLISDSLGKELARVSAIKILKECGISSPARIVDSVIPKEIESESEEDSKSLILKIPELWPEPVNGAQLFKDLIQTLARFLSAREGLLEVVALWILYAHAFDAFDISPILAITSPEKRCGKSTLLMMINELVPKSLAVSNITASALFRTIEKYGPTLLIDEADTFLTDNESLRSIINCGHTKKTSYVIRSVGEDHDPQRFTTWAPKVIAMIGSLPGTIEDRAIIIKMQRKAAGEKKEKLRFDQMGEFEDLLHRAARWAADNIDELRALDAEVPEAISNDRARDNWRILLSIADIIGSNWPKRAREIACTLAGVEPSAESPLTLILQDLKTIFKEKGEKLSSDDIILSLIELENRSWAEWRTGKSISKQGLAKLLKPLEIEPQKWREGSITVRGYHLNQFTEAFSRYIPLLQSPQSPHDLESIACSDSQSPHEPIHVATANGSNPNKIKDVATVATATGEYQESNVGTWGEL